MSDINTIVGLLVIILFLIIAFIILSIFYVFIPISRMQDNMNNLTQKLTQAMANINADISQINK